MRDCLQLFEKSLEDQAQSKNLQNHLMYLIEIVFKELENERNTTTNLQQQIIKLTEKDVFGVTSKFSTLKAEYTVLTEKLNGLKNENDDLNIQLIGKNQETKQRLAEKEEEIRSYYLNQLKQKEEELQQKDKETEKFKEIFKQKEKELYNEIQAVEVSSGMELDKMEEDFRKQLNESNKKLKDSMDTCNVLRLELMSVKEQFVEYKRTSSEKIAELQKRLREPQPQEFNNISIAKPRQGDSENNQNNVSNNTDDTSSRYQPLDVSFRNFGSSDDKPINLKKEIPIYRGCGRRAGQNLNNTLPPLINLKTKTSVKGSKVANKKRKLFNPDDLSYLSMDTSDKDY